MNAYFNKRSICLDSHVVDLAKHCEEGYIPLKDIAERQDLSQKYLEAIFKPLSDAGFVTGMRGKNGGYRLAKDPADISILDVLEITEGGVEPVSCLTENGKSASSEEDSIMWLWMELHKSIKEFLDSKNLANLLKGFTIEENVV